MTSLAPVAAPVAANTTTHDQPHQRTPLEYGAAVTHRDLVREKLRVDPASIAHKKRPAQEMRRNDPHCGRSVDIEV